MEEAAFNALQDRLRSYVGWERSVDQRRPRRHRRTVHVLGITVLGLHLLDYLNLADLQNLCQREGRWSFLCVVAPLRVPGAIGSPANPIAIV